MPFSLLRLFAPLWCFGLACGGDGPAPSIDPGSPRAQAFLDTLEQRTFNFFWERSDPLTGLTPDRWPTLTFSSIAAVGFALTAYPIGVEQGYLTRTQAQATGVSGYQGFFYHFLDLQNGHRSSGHMRIPCTVAPIGRGRSAPHRS